MPKEARAARHAIDLNNAGKFAAAIEHLRTQGINMQFGWFERPKGRKKHKGVDASFSRIKGMNKYIRGISTPMQD